MRGIIKGMFLAIIIFLLGAIFGSPIIKFLIKVLNLEMFY